MDRRSILKSLGALLLPGVPTSKTFLPVQVWTGRTFETTQLEVVWRDECRALVKWPHGQYPIRPVTKQVDAVVFWSDWGG